MCRTLVLYTVVLLGGLMTSSGPVSAGCDPAFRRGDTNGDGRVDVSDALRLLGHLFLASPALPCDDAGDANDDGVLNLTDPVLLLGHLFLGQSAPLPPSFACGRDPTPDALDCREYRLCPPIDETEVCDGIDNDCDGEIDEETDLASDPENCGDCGVVCAEENWPHVARYACRGGHCHIAECESGWFDEDGRPENGCEASMPTDFTPCDDGNPCTENDFFIGGICGGTPKRCSDLDDPCNRGVCDRETGECVQRPRPRGVPCDDEDPGTQGDRCDGEGRCVGTEFP